MGETYYFREYSVIPKRERISSKKGDPKKLTVAKTRKSQPI